MRCNPCYQGNFSSKLIRIIFQFDNARVEGENTRLRHYLARLHRQTLCYSKCVKMLENSLPLLIHYLKFKDVPVPYTFACSHQFCSLIFAGSISISR
ncbi:MAG: IS1 family transposase [Microcystis aeruginosa Ma_QC_C_20070703_M131]|uniref:IS1 family transposase n=1 Tax=Microcystis aeruginosa Ma_QC_C_20070703_M131 TaxID=2486263 RepID=A0A551X4B2_MICAE|nr:MAG: IS1 family transposase [Microcystis aeruginosa Ma_QC_C_20070703_M131]